MAHSDQLQLVRIVKSHLPEYFQGTRVLEIGSWDTNGSVRSDFQDAAYTGVDVASGSGVDEICQGQVVSYPSSSFDVVLSCECMEHNPYWAETIANMLRMTRDGGLFIMTCATTGREEHGTTRTTPEQALTVGIGWEYYRNIQVRDVRQAVNIDGWLAEYVLMQNWQMYDLYLVGIKRPVVGDQTQRFASLRRDLFRTFRPFRSFRSGMIYCIVNVLGEVGVNRLRTLYRIANRT